MPDILTETLVTFTEALQHIPEVGPSKRLVKTIYNWVDSGVTIHGRRVKLEAARIGCRRVTSVEAIARFLAATSAPETPAEPVRTPHQRNKASEAARRECHEIFATIAKQRYN